MEIAQDVSGWLFSHLGVIALFSGAWIKTVFIRKFYWMLYQHIFMSLMLQTCPTLAATCSIILPLCAHYLGTFPILFTLQDSSWFHSLSHDLILRSFLSTSFSAFSFTIISLDKWGTYWTESRLQLQLIQHRSEDILALFPEEKEKEPCSCQSSLLDGGCCDSLPPKDRASYWITYRAWRQIHLHLFYK